MKNIAIIDIESQGASTSYSSIISIAGILVNPDLKEIERFGKVCPQCQVSLPFVLWQQGINFDVIKDETIWNTDRYYITDHGTNNGHSYLSQ